METMYNNMFYLKLYYLNQYKMFLFHYIQFVYFHFDIYLMDMPNLILELILHYNHNLMEESNLTQYDHIY
jgi:hypothetical protein